MVSGLGRRDGVYEVGVEFCGDGHDEMVEGGEVFWVADFVVYC